MHMRFSRVPVLVLTCVSWLAAQSRPALINRSIDESRRQTLAGNTRLEARAANDAGAVPGDLPMEHMILQLTRSAADEKAVKQYIDSLHDSASANYHRWMTANEFGAAFGAAEADRATVVKWLESHGFTVDSIAAGGMTINFSGTAAQVSEAFHTEIHYLNVKGARHIANMSDPSIPEALAPVVAGAVSLHDFSPRPMRKRHADYTFKSGGTTWQALTPGDLATIYNLTPLFKAGVTGKGQTIALIEDTDLFKTTDWTTFRSTFGLSQYTSGSLVTVHPAPTSGKNNCKDPGVANGDDGEAAVDVEWASAAAPNAAIELVSCAGSAVTFGGQIALQNMVNAKNPPSIVSISYGECEAENGAASNAAFNSIYQQAVAEGISVFVSAGDEGAASCDAGNSGATLGIGVSAFASTPYNVAVGGTDFGDTYANTNSSYWSKTNSATYESALSYIPEIPWNDSCASLLLAKYNGYSAVYGTAGFCGSSLANEDGYLAVQGGSGGPSGCATGTPSSEGVVSGTCAGYAKPSWQTGFAGNPADGVRDIPDLSFFAATGTWNHYLVDCWSNIREGGSSCAGAPSSWDGGGGTSYSSPILAGIQALVNEQNGGAQGNPNYVYYKLAAISGRSCDASATPGTGCVFHNVTEGDNDVNCTGKVDCYGAAQNTRRGGWLVGGGGVSYNGALSTSDSTLMPAYTAGTGWNFATGLGSVNAYELVSNWSLGK